MNLWGKIMSSTRAAVGAWRDAEPEPPHGYAGRYELLWEFWSGTWRADPAIRRLRRTEPRVYENTMLVYNIARAVVRLYAQHVYMGDLSTNGEPLPDGTRGAIPIDPQTGNAADDKAILTACGELFNIWNWRQHMSLRPKFAAILGDCLTELVDDPERGVVLPRTVWPGYVTDLELDLVGNVKRYAIEYPVAVDEGDRFGQHVPAESYVYRKEVDGDAFRYYKDGKPFAYPDIGASEEPNPYGFVPAVWDRHEIVWGDRGMGAFEPAVQALRAVNSTFSHAIDYQRKQFSAPVGVKGQPGSLRRGGQTIIMPGAAADPPITLDGRRDSIAQTLNLLPLDDNGGFESVTFDVGKTVDLMAFVRDSLTAEFPEATYGQEILKMTQVTGPGVERALGPVVGLVKQARANHDPQTVKLLQMAVAIMGYRLANGDYPAEVIAARPARYAPFRTFDLSSYGQGRLDFGIPDREVIPETLDERIQRLLAIETLSDPWSKEQAGVPKDVIARQDRDRQANMERLDAQLSKPVDADAATGDNEDARSPVGDGKATTADARSRQGVPS